MAFRVTRPVGRNRIVARNSLPSGCPRETGARQPQAGPPAAYERSDHGPVRSGAAPLRTKLLIATRSSRPDSFWSHVHSCSDVPAQRRAAAHPSSSSLSRPHPRRIPTGRHRPVVEGERPAEAAGREPGSTVRKSAATSAARRYGVTATHCRAACAGATSRLAWRRDRRGRRCSAASAARASDPRATFAGEVIRVPPAQLEPVADLRLEATVAQQAEGRAAAREQDGRRCKIGRRGRSSLSVRSNLRTLSVVSAAAGQGPGCRGLVRLRPPGSTPPSTSPLSGSWIGAAEPYDACCSARNCSAAKIWTRDRSPVPCRSCWFRRWPRPIDALLERGRSTRRRARGSPSSHGTATRSVDDNHHVLGIGREAAQAGSQHVDAAAQG